MKPERSIPAGIRSAGCFIVLITILFIAACSPSHILHTRKQLGRDDTYVDFARNTDPFEISGFVEGEQIKAVKIIGFQGDKYLIEFTNQKGIVDFHITGTGAAYKKIDPFSGTIIVRDPDAIVSIETCARPAAEYTLRITPLKQAKEQKGFSLFFWNN